MNLSKVRSYHGRVCARFIGLLAITILANSVIAIQLAPSALAQSNVAQAETENLLRDTPDANREIEKTRREAEKQRDVLPTRKVTYADILANPDDIELNLAYAQNQIADGDVLGASATFERILLLKPDHARARLLYAIVLFRLDNLQEAERELTAVSKQSMPAGLRSEINRYLDQIKLRRKTTRYSVMASAGGQYDWNRNSAPASNQLLVGDLLGSVDESDIRTQDHAYNGQLRFEFDHDLGYQARHRLKGSISHYRAEQRLRKELDLRVSTADLDLVYDAAPMKFIPSIYIQQVTLADRYYAFNMGAKLRGEYQYNAATQFFGHGKYVRERYLGIPTSTSAPEKSGPKMTLGVGVGHTLSPTMKITVETDHIVKHAQRNFNIYRGQSLKLSHNWLLGKGMFLITSLSGEIDRYETGDPSVSGSTRHDRIGKAGMTFGIPLNTVIPTEIPIPVLRDLYMTVSVSATRQLSNLTNYTYNNRTASVQLSKRWEF